MKKTVSVPLFFLLLAGLLATLEMAIADSTLGPDNNGTKVHLRAGERLRITLPSNPSTGYDWHEVSVSANLLELESQEFIPPRTDNMPGAGGKTTLCFRANSPQATLSGDLVLGYFRIWEGKDSAEESYTLHITVEP